MKIVWIKLSVDSILSDIAWKEANGFGWEAQTLKNLFKMTKEEKKLYEIYLESNKASKLRREQNYPES